MPISPRLLFLHGKGPGHVPAKDSFRKPTRSSQINDLGDSVGSYGTIRTSSDLRDDVPRSTLTVHSHLFSIITPAKVDVLERLLESHPNQPLVHEIRQEEEMARCYSPPFTGDLLPGMFSMPVHAVPKPHSEKLRFMNNHSAGSFSLNIMIDKRSVGMRPDNVQDLAHNLLHFRKSFANTPVHLSKSDISLHEDGRTIVFKLLGAGPRMHTGYTS
ncbi:hypothetical protein PYCCODRAFT_1429273, partial [Trametes coccinea BRFM310]